MAGAAALLDMILTGEAPPQSCDVSRLTGGPGLQGAWLPGGNAATIALAVREQGHDVRLWHPLPVQEDAACGLDDLRQAGIDLSVCPRIDAAPPRCVMIYHGETRSSWSSTLQSPLPVALDRLFAEVTDLIVAPLWGEWASALLHAATERRIRTWLVGHWPAEAAAFSWHGVIADAQQSRLQGRWPVEVVTRGSKGADLQIDDVLHRTVAVPVRAVDPTGAGDTFGGTLIGALLAGRAPAEAASEASVWAARACTSWGARAAFQSSAFDPSGF